MTHSRKKIARSLLQLIAFNIAEVSFLYAKLYEVKHILFTGSFILNKLITQIFIENAFMYFAESTGYTCEVGVPMTKCFFNKNEGFFGALAAMRHALFPEFKTGRLPSA